MPAGGWCDGCPAGRGPFPRPSLPAGRDFGPVRTFGAFPPTAARQVPLHEATGGYAVRSPCPSGIPRPRHHASLPWAGGIAPVLTFWLHRFASLGLKSGIDARFALVLTFWLHRFASLGLKSRIDARFLPRMAPRLQRFASLSLKSRINAAPSCRQSRTAPPAAVVAATAPRPILFFKKKGG